MPNKRLDDIAILRVCCILVVVLFHCYGMMYASAHFPETVSVYKQWYFTLNQCVFINIAMPLFVLISGYLFIFLLQLGKYPTWKNLLRKKGLRILLPYFVFGLFFMATTENWEPLQLLNGGYWHLWFLPMLFWCFILGFAIYRMKLNIVIEFIILLITFIGSFMSKFVPMWLGLHNITCWFYWFYIGMFIYKYKETLYKYIENYKLYIYFLLFYAITTYLQPIEYGSEKWYSNLSVTGCLISIIYFMDRVNWSKYKRTIKIVKFSRYSFGIYIWHNWVAMMLISNTSKQFHKVHEI